ncbi:MAG: hypothetical protein Q4A71_08455 [Actinomycetaceae bacterium]|nr:hypothetical protein [Actinomycetaceae bacterium]
MALFELDEGKLVPAQFGRNVDRGVGPEVLGIVRAQLLEVISRPLFPVAWDNDEPDQSHGPHRLTALDAGGHVVAVEVISKLDAVALISSLSRLGDLNSLGWLDLAEAYPGGPEAFRAGWTEFRESMPPSPEAGPRLIIVTGNVDPAVRPSLDVLAGSGLEIHEINLREMSNGRRFLDVEPIGPSYWSSNPALSGKKNAAYLTAGPEHAYQVNAGYDAPIVEADETIEPDPEFFFEDDETEVENVTIPHPGSNPDELAEFDSPAEFAESAYATSVENIPGEHEAKMQSVPQIVKHDAEGLRIIATLLGVDTPVVASVGDHMYEAVLTSTGHINFGGQTTTDASFALGNTVSAEDAWNIWRLGHAQGPSLAEAVTEINAEIARETQMARK